MTFLLSEVAHQKEFRKVWQMVGESFAKKGWKICRRNEKGDGLKQLRKKY